MDWAGASQTAITFLKKNRYAVLILILGLMLMTLPQPKTSHTVQETQPNQSEKGLSQQLEELLCQLQGAGEVKVLLTCSAGAETVYQQKEEYPSQSGDGTVRREPVLVTDAQRQQSGLVRKELGPEYLGAVILCQGADNASVRLAIVEAVSNATGLPTNCISVLKMK